MQHNITHAEMVAKLIKQGDVLKSEFTSTDCMLLHATIGIVGEFGELLGGIDYAVTKGTILDMLNVIEELGDLEFFLENFRSLLMLDRNDILRCETVCLIPKTTLQTAAHMMVYSTELLDQVKKSVIYRKTLNKEAIFVSLSKIEYLLEAFRFKCGITREQTIQHNMDKLAVRYQGFQYTDQRAQERADKPEEKEIFGLPQTREEDGSN